VLVSRELDTTDVFVEQDVGTVVFTALSNRPVQLWGGSQWVDTFRIVPLQAHGSVFTVRDLASRAGDTADGGGEAGRWS
jgi:hypothetical protein